MKKLKRALRGYSLNAVQQLLSEMQDNHRIRMEELREQSAFLGAEQVRLTAELDRLAQSDQNKPVALSEQSAAQRLLEAYIEQSENVWQALQLLRSQDERLTAEEASKQAEQDKMLMHVETRLKETLDRMAEGRGMA